VDDTAVMAYQLNPSKALIWQTEHQLKLGLSETDQTIDDVTSEQERLINLLFEGVAEDQISVVANSVGLEEKAAQELIERLRPSLLEPGEPKKNSQGISARFAEIIRVGFETNTMPDQVFTNRSSKCLHLPRLDRTGLTLIKGLSELGFRKFETADYGFVNRDDLGELGFHSDQLGIARLSATRTLLETHASDSMISHPPTKPKLPVDLTILSAMHGLVPNQYRSLATPHLAIEYGIDQLRVSKVIRLGVDPCLGCRDLWASESDPTWAQRSMQLAARNETLDDGAALLLATSIAMKIIARNFDDPTAENLGYVMNLRTRVIQPHFWQFHPNCGCKTATTERDR
jgi:hypothetical protein